MDEIKHSHPTGERDDGGELLTEGQYHTLTFFAEGKKVGNATFGYYGKPIRFFHVRGLYVNDEDQEKGYGRKLMNAVQEFIIEKKCPGILQHGIRRDAPEGLKTMYERGGWQRLPAPHRKVFEEWFGYNLPSDIDETTLARMIDRTDVYDSKDREKLQKKRY